MLKTHTNLQARKDTGEFRDVANGLQYKNQDWNSQGIDEREGHKDPGRGDDATQTQEGNKDEQHHKFEDEKRCQSVDPFQVAGLLNPLHLLAARK